MKKSMLIWVMAAVVGVSAGCLGNSRNRVEPPRERFDPEEAFSEVPHSGFEAVWLEGGMTDEENQVYQETYDFVLTMEKAVIPYKVSGKVVQVCEYSDSEDRWNVERRTEDVIQEMDLSVYRWMMEESSFLLEETFVKTGPNTFAVAGADHPSEPYFTVDVLNGGTELKDKNGRTCLPGGQWTARLYIEFISEPKAKVEGAIDLIGGFYGFNDLRWIVPIKELQRAERERNTTDEERAAQELETFRMTFPKADSFERMDPNLAAACSRELAASDYGHVGVNKAAAAKDKDGTLIGWVVQAYSKDGFGGDVVISVAVNRDGTISGLEFLQLEETPGLGMRAGEAAFKDQFLGKGGEPLTVDTQGDGDGFAIDAISGATHTTNAVTNAVNGVLYYVNHYTE